jgi:hypothetical protein
MGLPKIIQPEANNMHDYYEDYAEEEQKIDGLRHWAGAHPNANQQKRPSHSSIIVGSAS